MKDYNSTVNQEIKGKFVGREVVQNCSQLITHLLQTMHDGAMHDYYDELTNLGYSLDYETAAENEGWEFNEDLNLWVNEDEEETYETAEDVCDGENIDPEYIEPYEFWIVSDYLGDKLKEKEQIVEEVFGLTIWGRCTTGQAILLDHVISQICDDLEILEGQKNDWSKY
jgi:hypothetical protein